MKTDYLTSLRWFSALYLFLFHSHLTSQLSDNRYIKAFIENGYSGMTFFFILSGFILTHVYHNKTISYFDFIKRRLARIYPAFIVMFIATLIFVDFDIEGGAYIFNFFSNIFLIHAWFPNLFKYGVNGGTWSLSVEWFMYLLFPFIIKNLINNNLKTNTYLLAVFYIFSCLPGIAHYIYNSGDLSTTYYATPIYRLPEFICGILTYLIVIKSDLISKIDPKKAKFIMISIIAIFIIISCLLVHKWNLMLINFISVPAYISIILLPMFYKNHQFLENKILKFLGEVSYGFYLFQFVSFRVLAPYLKEAGFNSIEIMLCSFFITLSIATLSFKYIESYAREKINLYKN